MMTSLFGDTKDTTRPSVKLFDGTECQMCVLAVGGEYGTYAIWDASDWAQEEINNVGATDLLPDGPHDGRTNHLFAVVTLKWDDGEEPDVLVDRFIPVTAKGAMGHKLGQPLWTEEECS